MQIFVRCGGSHVGAQTLALEVDGQQSVAELKQQVSERKLVGPSDMVLFYGGKVLQDDASLCAYALQQGSTVQFSVRLRGGGGDGGSTGAESRSCYLEMYLQKKPDKVNPAEELLARWTRCHLTGQSLRPPCVVDELGTLFNKDAVVTALLSKAIPEHLAYITGLKSVVELKLEPNPAKKKDAPKMAAKGSHQPGNDADFCCPITGLEFNGRFKFCAHRATGLVVAEKAIKEVPKVVEELLATSKPIAADEWIPINPPEEQLHEMRKALAAKLAAEREKKAKKKAAKAEKNGAGPAAGGEEQAAAAGEAAGLEPGSNRAKAEAGSVTGSKRSASPPAVGAHPVGSVSGAPAAAAAAVVTGAMLPPPAKKVKATALEVMPQNATKSVYASLFTSSRPEEKETYLCRSTSARGIHMT